MSEINLLDSEASRKHWAVDASLSPFAWKVKCQVSRQPGHWSQPQEVAMWLSTGLALITLYNDNKTPTYPFSLLSFPCRLRQKGESFKVSFLKNKTKQRRTNFLQLSFFIFWLSLLRKKTWLLLSSFSSCSFRNVE